MSKELEALERIKQASTIYVGCYSDIYTRYSYECKIIETALKEHECMKQARFIVANKEISDDDIEKLINQRMFDDSLEHCEIKMLFDEETQKKLKALDEILALYGKWLGYKIGDYEFFVLLNDMVHKYDLLNEVLL